MKITNLTKNTVIATKTIVANTLRSRSVGLLNHTSLPSGEALVIDPCQSIHMFFMRFPIDVIFVGKDDYVVGLVKEIKPFRLSPIFFKSLYAIEAAAGTIVDSQTSLGDKIKIES